jgi:hypothetical protein
MLLKRPVFVFLTGSTCFEFAYGNNGFNSNTLGRSSSNSAPLREKEGQNGLPTSPEVIAVLRMVGQDNGSPGRFGRSTAGVAGSLQFFDPTVRRHKPVSNGE